MEDIAIIFNPNARSEKSRGLADVLRELAPQAELRMTDSPGQARRMAAQAALEGFRVVAAAGGDGTVNEVVNGIAGSERGARHSPRRHDECLRRRNSASRSDLDEAWAVIRAGSHAQGRSRCAANSTLTSSSSQAWDSTRRSCRRRAWEFRKRTLGPLSYVISAAQIAARKPPRLIVEAGRHGTGKAPSSSSAMAATTAAPIVVFPKTRASDDGLLDVLIFKNLGYLDIARYLAGVFIGRHTGMEDVEYFQVSEARVHSAEEVPVEVDGELSGALPVTFRVAGKLRICVP